MCSKFLGRYISLGWYKKYHRLGVLTDIYFSHVQDQVWQIYFLVRILFWLADSHLLTVSSHEGESGSGVSFSSYKDSNPIMKTAPSWSPLNLVMSQSSHLQIPSHWGLGLQHGNFGGTNIQPPIGSSRKLIQTLLITWSPWSGSCVRAVNTKPA